MVLVGAGAMCQEQAGIAVPGNPCRDSPAVPFDRLGGDHDPNLGHTVTVLSMEYVVHATPDDLAGEVSGRIAQLVSESDGLTIGLAGGGSPRATYLRLRELDVEWGGVDFWLSDERWVPWDHERCNGLMASESLLDHVGGRFHRPPWGEMIEPEDSAAHYEAMLRSLHADRVPDLLLLGIGGDGHTASLFPGTEALGETRRWYVANEVPELGETRLTATFPLLWRARRVMFLVTGARKATAVRDSFAGRTPAGKVGDGDGEVTWHLDEKAASQLS